MIDNNHSRPRTIVATELHRKAELNISPPGYVLQEILGHGGFSVVYRAVQNSTGQSVALKILRLEDISGTQRQRSIDRFHRETQLCAELHHPHIVKLLDKGQFDNDTLYAVFEYVPGETLKELLLHRGALPAIEAGELMGQVLDALTCAHAKGVVHRDLKPQNIMITSTGTRPHVKVLDFGIGAFLPEARQYDYKSLTITQEALGTPSYSAPEQLRGEPPTVKSDLYAWGLLFVECLTGVPVMQGSTLAETFHKQLNPGNVPLPPAIADHPVSSLLRRVLQKKPAERSEKAALVYADFRKLNLNNIVGEIRMNAPFNSPGYDEHSITLETTKPIQFAWTGPQTERRQITVLNCSLSVTAFTDSDAELEALEALQSDLVSSSIDIGIRYGGHFSGVLGDSVLLYFGYPYVSDNDARRAARTALDLAVNVRRRSELLEAQRGVQLEFRIGLHTGTVLVQDSNQPSGLTVNTALKLAYMAPANSVLVSEPAQRLLQPYAEFQPHALPLLSGCNKPLETYLLSGERSAEALSFMRERSTGFTMVGRDSELRTVNELWALVLGGRGGGVLITGEPGIGKSRLVYEFRKSVLNSGYFSRDVRCLPEHQNNALYPILEMLKTHLRLPTFNQDETAVNRLKTFLLSSKCDIDLGLPILCSWLGLSVQNAVKSLQHSPDMQKRVLIETLVKALAHMGGNAPCLLIIEDVHWIDPTSLELLGQLLEAAPHNGFFMLITAREHFISPWAAQNLPHIVMRRLQVRDAELLVSQTLGNKPIEQSSLQRIVSRTDGVPLFIEELSRMLLDSGRIVEEAGQLQLKENDGVAAVPITLRDSLNERLGRLGPAKETLQLAAILGREFNRALLTAVSLRNSAEVQADLDLMMSGDLVYQQRRVQGESYIFRHALIRDAAYESMMTPVKIQMHSRIAEILETEFADIMTQNPGEVARHFGEAQKFEKAAYYSNQAARLALSRSLNDETIEHAHKALAWLARVDSINTLYQQLEINNSLTQALMAKHGWANNEVKDVVERSALLVKELGSSELTVPTLWSLIVFHHVASNRRAARDLLNELLKVSHTEKDKGLDVAIAAINGLCYHTEGKYAAAAEALLFSLEHYDKRKHANHGTTFGLDTYVWAAAALALVQWFQGETDSAVDYSNRAVARAKKLNHVPSLGIALMYCAMVHQYAGDKPQTDKVSSELLQLSSRYGLPAYAGYATILNSWANNDIATIDQVVEGLKMMGCNLALSYYASLAADLIALKGDYSYAIKRIDFCLQLCETNNEYLYLPELYRRKAEYQLAQGTHYAQSAKLLLKIAAANARKLGMHKTEADVLQTFSHHFHQDLLNEVADEVS